MVQVKFNPNAMPCDDNLTADYPKDKELLDILIGDPDVMKIIDKDTGKVLFSR